jgi:hypothetical protein
MCDLLAGLVTQEPVEPFLAAQKRRRHVAESFSSTSTPACAADNNVVPGSAAFDLTFPKFAAKPCGTFAAARH